MTQSTQYAAGEWTHLFGAGNRETRCRIVVDVGAAKVIAAQEWTGLKFEDVRGERLADIHDSVINANEANKDPAEFDLAVSEALPNWAKRPAEEYAAVDGARAGAAVTNKKKYAVLLTLISSGGRVGQGLLGSGQPLTWDCEPETETERAIFSRINRETLEVVEVVPMEGDDWREFEDAGAEATFLANVANGHGFAEALNLASASTKERSAGSVPRG